MPLINIYLKEGKSDQFLDDLSQELHEALMETWKIPANDRFHIFHQKKANEIRIDPTIFDVARSDDVIVFHLSSSPRSKEMKTSFYKALAKRLAVSPGVRPEDVFISIIENSRSDWSFGNGLAQLLEQ